MKTPSPIAVVGGGPAGAVCARELALSGHAVRLFSMGGGNGPEMGEMGSPVLIRLLWNAGLTIPPSCGQPLDGFRVAWEDDALFDKSSPAWDVASTHAIYRASFDQWLQGEAARAGVTIGEGRVVRAEPDGDGWRVFIVRDKREKCITARFVVEATGRGSRSLCHPRTVRHYSDNLVGVSIDVPSPIAESCEALVEAAEAGWWYALQVGNGRAFVCYFTDAKSVPKSANRARWWSTQFNLSRHIRKRIGSIAGDVPFSIWDARTSIRSVLWRLNCLAIGDAAWAIDPLSGAGVEGAVRSGIAAGKAISEAFRSESDEPLRDFAIDQVNSFRKAIWMQRRFYTSVNRFDSAFWKRRTAPDPAYLR